MGMVEKVSLLPRISFCFVGCALCRSWLGWFFVNIREFDLSIGESSIDYFTLFRIGEIIGFLIPVLLATKFSQLSKHGAALVFPITTLLLFGTLCAAMPSHFYILPLASVVGITLTGVGYSVLLLLWLELYGCLATKYALLAYASSYFLNFLIWGVLQNVSPELALIAMSIFPFLSIVLLALGYRKIPLEHQPLRLPIYRNVPWKLLFWVAVFAFAYGMGDSITSAAFSTLSARIGMALPEITILVGIVFFAKKFDFTMLYKTTLLLMSFGLVLAIVAANSSFVSQVAMSAANESYLVLAYAIAWALAYRLRCSSVLYCGLVGCVNIACIQIGFWSGTFVQQSTGNEPLSVIALGAFIIILAIAISTLVFGEQDYTEALAEKAARPSPASPSRDVGETYGLSPKELAVFAYLKEGLSAPEIAEELFLAPGTVRAHTSHIYQKMGINSRKEFNEIMRSL